SRSIASYISLTRKTRPAPRTNRPRSGPPVKRRIHLRGINGAIEGKTWDSDSILRAGRLATLEIVLDDSSVSRRHAEIRATDKGWRVRDLGSTNGTFLNGTRLNPGEWPVRPHDIIRFGNVTIVVDSLLETPKEEDENT